MKRRRVTVLRKLPARTRAQLKRLRVIGDLCLGELEHWRERIFHVEQHLHLREI